MGFSTAQGSTAHAQGVLKIEKFVPCGHTHEPVVKWRKYWSMTLSYITFVKESLLSVHSSFVESGNRILNFIPSAGIERDSSIILSCCFALCIC